MNTGLLHDICAIAQLLGSNPPGSLIVAAVVVVRVVEAQPLAARSPRLHHRGSAAQIDEVLSFTRRD